MWAVSNARLDCAGTGYISALPVVPHRVPSTLYVRFVLDTNMWSWTKRDDKSSSMTPAKSVLTNRKAVSLFALGARAGHRMVSYYGQVSSVHLYFLLFLFMGHS